jgi:hypothetical protein
MRLDVDAGPRRHAPRSNSSPAGHVRATASYFRAGHLLLDSLTHSLQLEREIQALALPAGDKAETAWSDPAVSAGSRDLPQPHTLPR